MLLVSSLLCFPSAEASPAFKLPNCPQVGGAESAPEHMQEKESDPIMLDNDAKKQQTQIEDPDEKIETQEKKTITPYERAESVNCLPLPLMPSIAETQSQNQLLVEAHKKQLQDLWSATIERSPDIQFTIGVLQAGNKKKHATAQAMKLVGSAFFSLAPAFVPAGSARTGAGLGSPLISRLFKSSETTEQVSLSESIMLYKIVRDTADNLVESYRNYRRCLAERDAAETDLSDLKVWEREIETKSDAASFASYEFTLKKAQREAQLCDARVQIYKEQLLELCGEDALARLDLEIQRERETLAEIIGRPDIKPPLAPTEPSTADAAFRKKKRN